MLSWCFGDRNTIQSIWPFYLALASVHVAPCGMDTSFAPDAALMHGAISHSIRRFHLLAVTRASVLDH